MGDGQTDEAGYADWLTVRIETLTPSIERLMDLKADPHRFDGDNDGVGCEG